MYALKYTLKDGQEKFICQAHKTDVFIDNIFEVWMKSDIMSHFDFLKDKTIVIISPPVESDEDI